MTLLALSVYAIGIIPGPSGRKREALTEFIESERLQNLNGAASLESMGHGSSASPRIPCTAATVLMMPMLRPDYGVHRCLVR